MTLNKPDPEFQGIALREFCPDARHYVRHPGGHICRADKTAQQGLDEAVGKWQ